MLKVITLNAQGMNEFAKLDSLINFMKKTETDLALIQETHMPEHTRKFVGYCIIIYSSIADEDGHEQISKKKTSHQKKPTQAQ